MIVSWCRRLMCENAVMCDSSNNVLARQLICVGTELFIKSIKFPWCTCVTGWQCLPEGPYSVSRCCSCWARIDCVLQAHWFSWLITAPNRKEATMFLCQEKNNGGGQAALRVNTWKWPRHLFLCSSVSVARDAWLECQIWQFSVLPCRGHRDSYVEKSLHSNTLFHDTPRS